MTCITPPWWIPGSTWALLKRWPELRRYQLEHIASHTALFEAAFKADVWVFYDYTSLFQYERDANSHEERSFRKAMANMHLMYCHECNLTLRIESLTPEDTWNAMKANEKEPVPVWDQESKTVKALPLKSLVENRNLYLERGWCMAEVEWSSLRRANAQHQRIDKPKAGKNSDKSEGDQNLNGKIPMTPKRFKAAMESSKFTHRSDAATVIHLQEKIYFEKVMACEELILEGLTGTEIAALAATLPDFKNLKTMKAPLTTCKSYIFICPDWWQLWDRLSPSFVCAWLVSCACLWALWCLPASTASAFRFLTSNVSKKRPKLWVRLEIGWCLMSVFPATFATLQHEWMIDTQLGCNGCSRRWQKAGSRDLSYMHLMELAIVSWPRRCCLLSSTHYIPCYLHVPAFRVMTSCGKLSRCLGHRTVVFVDEVIGRCKHVHGLGSTSCKLVKSKAHAHLISLVTFRWLWMALKYSLQATIPAN